MKNFLKKINKPKIILIGIILLAAFFRLYGLNWDQNQHLHPDERFLTMVVSAMKIPSSFSNYLDPSISTMNPYNLGFGFFVYGNFPLYLTKIIGDITSYNTYDTVHFVGRTLSEFFDLGVILFLFKIGKKIFNEKVGLISSFLYSIMVLPIQLSHFFCVDTFLNFFIVLSFYLIILLITKRKLLITSVALSVSFGLALACKISALYFLPIIGLSYLYLLGKEVLLQKKANLKKISEIIIAGVIFLIFSLLIFRLNQPQVFSDKNYTHWQINPNFSANLAELERLGDSTSMFPPAIQWKNTTPIIFPLKNLVLWGTGLPLGILSVFSVIYLSFVSIKRAIKKKNFEGEILVIILLMILWIIGLFAYEGTRFTKTIRYFLLIYPFLALASAKLLTDVENILSRKNNKLPLRFVPLFFYLTIFIYPFSFLSIYTKPITRISASEWIFKNIPPGSILLNEEWDDALPISLPGKSSLVYDIKQIYMYDPDSVEKWKRILPKIHEADYIILTSNRAYGSTMKLPSIYPETVKYYNDLFNSNGQFKKIAEFTSYPCFPPGKLNFFCFNDDGAEESFTVYDHPKVLIFKNQNEVQSKNN